MLIWKKSHSGANSEGQMDHQKMSNSIESIDKFHFFEHKKNPICPLFSHGGAFWKKSLKMIKLMINDHHLNFIML